MSGSASRRGIVSILLGLLVALPACDAERANDDAIATRREGRPDVLVVTIDTARADRFSYTGRSRVETRVTDSIAQEGAGFLEAVSPVPVTLPAHASLFTGRLPPSHGVRSNGVYRLPESEQTLAEIFQSAGYRTGAFVGAAVLARRYGLAQGFDRYDDILRGASESRGRELERRSGEAVVASALAWLREQGDQPTFQWVHLFDPHAPYRPPEPERSRYPGMPYDAAIAHADRVVGTLLDGYRELGRWEDTIVVVTSDHGESLGEHGERTHGIFIYDSTVLVPLVIKGPGVPRGVRIEEQVRLIDVAPTLLDLTSLPAPSLLEGRSLVPLLSGELEAERSAYLESLYPRIHHGWSAFRGIRTRQWKLVSGSRLELYDLLADPAEARDLSESQAPRTRALAARLDAHPPSATDRAGEAARITLSQAEQEGLAALGYAVTTVDSSSREDASLPDPHRMIHLMEGMDRSRSLLAAGDVPAALREAEAVVSEDPKNPHFLKQLADYYVYANRLAPALATLEGVLEVAPRDVDALSKRAYVLMRSGRLEDALRAFDEVLSIDALHRSSLHNRWATLLLLDRAARVEREAAAALQLDELDAEAWWAMLRARDALGTVDDLLPQIERAIARMPGEASLRGELAMLFERRGAIARAEQLYREVRALDPAEPLAAQRLARLLLNSGRASEAREILEGQSPLGRDVDQLLLLARSRALTGDLAGASRAFGESLASSPDRADIWAALAGVQIEQQDLPAAVASLRKSLSLDPGNEPVRAMLVQALERLGRRDEAQRTREARRSPEGA